MLHHNLQCMYNLKIKVVSFNAYRTKAVVNLRLLNVQILHKVGVRKFQKKILRLLIIFKITIVFY